MHKPAIYLNQLILIILVTVSIAAKVNNPKVVLITTLDSIIFPISTTGNIQTQPTTAINIPIDSSLSKWSTKNALYDASQSYDVQSGAVKFANTSPSYIISTLSIPVKPGEIYTLTARIKSTTTPPSVLTFKGAIKGGNGGAQNLFGTYASNSKANIWEEVTASIKIPDNTTHNKLYIKIVKESVIQGTIWVDNVQLQKGIQLEKRPSKKKFTGSIVEVDSLGNIKVSGRPYFPICIYGDEVRGLSVYKNQGFNTIAQSHTSGGLQKAKNAGMMANFEMGWYLSYHNESPKRTQTQLKADLQTIKDKGLMEHLLFYYWDNEFYHYKPEIDKIATIVNTIDTNNGRRMHPHYMLAENYAHTRIYHKFINLTGTYTSRDLTGFSPVTYLGEPLFYNLLMQDHAQNQSTPSSIGQFNVGVDAKFRALIFGGIANGMKGFGYWRDSAIGETNSGRDLDVTKQIWWDDLPSIASEIQQMLNAGLIQASHLTSFKAISNKPIDKIISGTRLLNGIGYIIVGNSTSLDETVTFNLNNLGYTPALAINFFNGSSIGTILENKIIIPIPAYSSRVIKLLP